MFKLTQCSNSPIYKGSAVWYESQTIRVFIWEYLNNNASLVFVH